MLYRVTIFAVGVFFFSSNICYFSKATSSVSAHTSPPTPIASAPTTRGNFSSSEFLFPSVKLIVFSVWGSFSSPVRNSLSKPEPNVIFRSLNGFFFFFFSLVFSVEVTSVRAKIFPPRSDYSFIEFSSGALDHRCWLAGWSSVVSESPASNGGIRCQCHLAGWKIIWHNFRHLYQQFKCINTLIFLSGRFQLFRANRNTFPVYITFRFLCTCTEFSTPMHCFNPLILF